MISKTIDIAVTSVLQTTAGKMIFGKFDERAQAAAAAASKAEPHPAERASKRPEPVSTEKTTIES